MSFGPTRIVALAVGLIGLIGWAVYAILDSGAALPGWHIGFLFWSGPAIGAMALLIIHRLTGGRWRAGFAPELEPASATVPLFCVLLLPILIGAPEVFRWAADPSTVTPSVHRWFLNPALYAVRSAVALLGWSVIAWRLSRLSQLQAGLALVFYGFMASVVSVDWVLSVQPAWPSSNFPMAFVTQQFALALAWAALQGRKRPAIGPLADVDGLLFATLLGLTYLQFMDYLVVWYGDRPGLDAWYLSRAADPWRWLLLAALALGGLLPTMLFILRHKVGRHRATRVAGLGVLIGGVLYDTWLIAPASGGGSLLPGALALVGIGGLWIALAGGAPRLAHASAEAAHG